MKSSSRLSAEPPVIISSGYACFKNNFMSWSAHAYLIKSSDLAELKSTVRTALDKMAGSFHGGAGGSRSGNSNYSC